MRNPIRTGLIFLLFSLVAGTAQACKPESIPASTPDSQLQDNGDGTVTDTKTGLMWKQCAEGLSGSNCASGTIEGLTWSQALLRAQDVNSGGGFAGFTDWRVPNIKELASLTELQCSGPAINLTRFPGTPGDPNTIFWSSSAEVGHSTVAWAVEFKLGQLIPVFNYDSYSLRLVRSVP